MSELRLDEPVATACADALAGTLSRYRLVRVVPPLTGDEAVTWANDVAFLSVVVEPLDPFVLYVGRLAGGDERWRYVDVDFFFEDAGVVPPDRGPMAPGLAELLDALRRYDPLLPRAVGRVLDGDMETFDRVVAEARARPDEDDE